MKTIQKLSLSPSERQGNSLRTRREGWCLLLHSSFWPCTHEALFHDPRGISKTQESCLFLIYSVWAQLYFALGSQVQTRPRHARSPQKSWLGPTFGMCSQHCLKSSREVCQSTSKQFRKWGLWKISRDKGRIIQSEDVVTVGWQRWAIAVFLSGRFIPGLLEQKLGFLQ